MFFDLGLDWKDFENSTVITHAIDALDKDFNLILIKEHFDESMVLLKRRLCWSIEDIIYMSIHVRFRRTVLSKTEIAKIEKWNNADVLLYDHFLKKFWKEVEMEGVGFYDDLSAFKREKEKYANICNKQEVEGTSYIQNLPQPNFCEDLWRKKDVPFRHIS